MRTYRITTASGNSWITSITATPEEAERYFLLELRHYVTECYETGKETADKITHVEEITE